MIIKSANKIRSFDLLRLGQSQFFSSAKGETQPASIQLLHDRAYLASNIIKRIKSRNNIDELSNLSLPESILTYLETVNNVKDQARSELLDYFKSGYSYDKASLSQSRFFQAQINQESKLKFYPTKFVTSQLFRKFSNIRSKATMYSGNFGISKSFSAVLYSRLSNMVAQYNFKNYPKKDYLDENSGIINSPKVIYYNFIQQDILNWKFREKILNQMSSQFSQNELNSYLNSATWMKNQIKNAGRQTIHTFYNKKGIQVVLFVDQISEFFSMLRSKSQIDAKNLQQKLKQEIEESPQKSKQEIEESQQKLKFEIQAFQNQIKSLDGQLYSIFYLSSLDIQTDLIKTSKLGSQNSTLHQWKIQYAQRLYEDEYMSEIIDVFIFSFKQRFQIQLLEKSQSHNNEIQSKNKSFSLRIKQRLFQYLRSRRLEYFLSFLYIRQEVNEKFQLEETKCQTENTTIYAKYSAYKESQLQQIMFQLFKDTIESSKGKLKILFKQFLEKRKLDQRFFSPILFEIYFAAIIAMKTGNNFYQYKIYLRKHNSSTRQMSKNLPRSIFKQIFSINNKDQVQFVVPPAIVIQILESEMTTVLPYIIKNKADLFIQILNKSVLGGCAQALFIQAIKTGNKKVILLDEKLSKRTIIQNIVSNWYRFEQINQLPKKDKNKSQKSSTANINEDQDNLNSISSHEKQNKQKPVYFLRSLKYGIVEQIKNMRQDAQNVRSVVFLPAHKKFITNKQIIDLIKQAQQNKSISAEQKQILNISTQLLTSGVLNFDLEVSHTSKAIDFIIVQIDKTSQTGLIKINAFDMTISDNQVFTKMSKFLEEFKNFSDKDQNELIYEEQVFTVEMSYDVLCPHENKVNVNLLNKTFGDTFSFQKIRKLSKESESRVLVKSSQNCILKQIGSYNFNFDVQILNNESKLQHDEKVQVWNYFKKRLYQSSEERKKNKKISKKLIQVLNELLGRQKVFKSLKWKENDEMTEQEN